MLYSIASIVGLVTFLTVVGRNKIPLYYTSTLLSFCPQHDTSPASLLAESKIVSYSIASITQVDQFVLALSVMEYFL
jgi:hypothetical protein